MGDDATTTGIESITTTTEPARRRGLSRSRLLMIAGIVGGVALVAYAYSAFRWGPVDSVTVLGLVFGLLLLGYAALAVVGIRAGVVAPFVVAALVLPWVCGAGAAAGFGQRLGGAIEGFANDLSGSSSLEEPGTPMAQESVQPTPNESDLAALSEEEVFPSPPADVAATALGQSVAFQQDLGDGYAAWKVTVTDRQCGVKSLKKAEYRDDGSLGTAKPQSGHEFCLVETTWTNTGKREAGGGTNILGSLMVAGKAIEHGDIDIGRGFGVMDQRNMAVQPVLKPGKSAPQIDVFEVPAGTTPDAVWISRDQPQALMALR